MLWSEYKFADFNAQKTCGQPARLGSGLDHHTIIAVGRQVSSLL
jgi:hypothetical protein